MIQDIAPHIFHNEYHPVPISSKDYICIFSGSSILATRVQDAIELPHWGDAITWGCDSAAEPVFLFSIDDIGYYLYTSHIDSLSPEGWDYVTVTGIRSFEQSAATFACALAGQLKRWYDKNRYCGHCGQLLNLHPKERALACSNCGQITYPSLSPSVIVAVTDQNRILLTKYAGRAYTRYALVAGYTEVGETLEDTVKREVLEEVGLHVKNIKYYKSQPWPFTDTLLVGYFAELDGDDTVTLEEDELSEATWFERGSIPETNSTLSLTNEMIETFRTRNDV